MQKFLFIATLVLLALSYTQAKGNAPKTASWEDFKNFHGKMYVSDAHEANHKANFDRNAKSVAAHNQAYAQGKVTYKKELNQFSDMDPNQFKTRNGFKVPVGPQPSQAAGTNSLRSSPRLQATLPKTFDWRTTGKVSPVKDQGQCGSCWSFSSTGAIESQVLIKSNVNRSLSEEQLVACDPYDNGCNGGFYTNAWYYIINKAGGITSTAKYPYSSGGGKVAACSFTTNSIVQKMTSYTQLKNNCSDTDLMSAIVQYGPVSVAIDASDMQQYSEDIYSCKNVNIDHAVLAVGYGTQTKGGDYWIVKNSWSTAWGDKGFFKIARGKNDCGILQYAAYPIL